MVVEGLFSGICAGTVDMTAETHESNALSCTAWVSQGPSGSDHPLDIGLLCVEFRPTCAKIEVQSAAFVQASSANHGPCSSLFCCEPLGLERVY